ncbi:hypothetical protein HPB49_023510 [Dermacentor silvarum]|uniref:Uncharacterized protein n=1 Tax=Dermacentor silvarum TaxID=543639 RepID=A0ACB8D8W4_DERSI|nr:hypothetical protein HPB49_023510 [Dermacentor silvarum]
MSGRLHGVQKILFDEQPKSYCIHCCNHALELALQEVSRKCDEMCEVQTIVKYVSNAILESAKRKCMYIDIVLEPCHNAESPKVKRLYYPLCPTRWTGKVKSLSRFRENYDRVHRTIEEILATPGAAADGRRAALIGFSKRMKRLETVFFLTVAIKVFGPCEQLARALKSAAGAKKAVEMLEKTLSDLRTQYSSDKILKEAEYCKEGMLIQISDTQLRMRKPPRRLEDTHKPTAPAQLSPDEKLDKVFTQL